jgi:3-hydroxyisobutyrate dehydrogenase-like beta-hydroxyacid dehydrogenase
MLLGAQKLGLEPAVLARVIGTSTGACWAAGTNNPVRGALPPDRAPPPCERGYDGGFATGLMLKVRAHVFLLSSRVPAAATASRCRRCAGCDEWTAVGVGCCRDSGLFPPLLLCFCRT